MAPTPKPPGQRVRRNSGQADWRQLEADATREVPDTQTDVQLGTIADAFWTTIWTSPMSAAYTAADVFPLTRLAVLVDQRAQYDRGELEDFDGDAEMRQLEDRFGISPLARRRLQWEIATGAKVAAVPEARTAKIRRIHAVDPHAA